MPNLRNKLQKYWRQVYYFTEENDCIIKIYFKVFYTLYNDHSGEECLPGEQNFMCRNELKRICTNGGITNETCGDKEQDLAFSISKETQIDTITTTISLRLKFIEFLEAFARIAEKSA